MPIFWKIRVRIYIDKFKFLRIVSILRQDPESRSRSNFEYWVRLCTVNMAKRLVTGRCAENETDKYYWMKLRGWFTQLLFSNARNCTIHELTYLSHEITALRTGYNYPTSMKRNKTHPGGTMLDLHVED